MRNFVLQQLSTSLEGRPSIHFLIFDGSGANGKSVLDNLLLSALGNFGITGNNSILYEKNRTGANPERANLDRKRLVIFREPPEGYPLENATIKEFTGGGDFSARTLFEKETTKSYHGTTVLECNRRPKMAEQITYADVRRIIDIPFPSKFEADDSKVNEEKHIFKADSYYETNEFRETYKRAFMKILMEAHKSDKLSVPASVLERTQAYLLESSDIFHWFLNEYEMVDDKEQYIKLGDVYENFRISEFFQYLTKREKVKYNKRNFIKYFGENSCVIV